MLPAICTSVRDRFVAIPVLQGTHPVTTSTEQTCEAALVASQYLMPGCAPGKGAVTSLYVRAPLPTTMVCLLLLDFNCAGGGRPAILAGIGHVAEVRID
jgi:hypothetical protein